MKCVLVVGHERSKKGASNELCGANEWDFNRMLANRVYEELGYRKSTIKVEIQYRDSENGLPLSAVPAEINRREPSFVIALHCNAHNRLATGTETLCWKGSIVGRKLAQCVQGYVVGALNLRDRGIKELGMTDRGGYLLGNVAAPAVLLESFFIDSTSDLATALLHYEELVDALANAIEAYGKWLPSK